MLSFSAGAYCYVGSAKNGLDQRLNRHMSEKKTIRWHIDRLTISAEDMEALESQIHECHLCEVIQKAGGVPCHRGFGCSDCGCHTHLFILSEVSRGNLFADPRFAYHARETG